MSLNQMKDIGWGSQMKWMSFFEERVVYYLKQKSWALWIIATILKQMRKWSKKICLVSPSSSLHFLTPECTKKWAFKAKKNRVKSLSFFCSSRTKFLLCIQYICPQSQTIRCLFPLEMQFFSQELCIICSKFWISYLS